MTGKGSALVSLRSRDKPITRHVSYCRICEQLCGIVADVSDGEILCIRGDILHPVSDGYICPKGATMGLVQSDPDRVRHPLRRKANGEFEEVDWDVALNDIATRLKRLRCKYGPDSIAMWATQRHSAFRTSSGRRVRLTPRVMQNGTRSAQVMKSSSRWQRIGRGPHRRHREIPSGVVSYPHGGHSGGWEIANGAGGANINLLLTADPGMKEGLSGGSHLDGVPVAMAAVRRSARPSDARESQSVPQ